MDKKHKGSNSLGRALIKDRFGRNQRRKVNGDSMLHTTEIQDGYDWGRLNLNSVTEESSLQDFLRTAELAGTEFQAEKLNLKYINPKQGVGLLSRQEQEYIQRKHLDKKELLKIPRRPKWSAEMSAIDLQKAENDSFLEWRRSLAILQEEDDDIILTPYEKNLEFWRQLWRVIERSDVIVQIVDARNPLLYRSEDLEKYVKEVDPKKQNMILINKSDLLTDKQREIWAQYFQLLGIKTAFFSATLASEQQRKSSAAFNDLDRDDELLQSTNYDKIETPPHTPETNLENSPKKSIKTIPTAPYSLAELKEAVFNINTTLDQLDEKLKFIEDKIFISKPTANQELNSSQLLDHKGLISLFKTLYTGPTHTKGVTTIGMVGYPNVGKSSTINALMEQKKVSTSVTPGKTKHFQTLYVDQELMLCDCPGLVMPSFALTKSDMILNGILPIDQLRDHVPPINLLCSRIPRYILEDIYGIVIAKPMEGEDPQRSPYAEELLLAYGYNRGFMTANGQPDQSRAARYILKDYVNGRLLYCSAPPDINQEEYHIYPERKRKEISEETLPSQQQRAMRIEKNPISSEALDKQFFAESMGKARIKGRTAFPHIRITGEGLCTSSSPQEKPWRSNKKEKREKLRKKFSHLDQH